ncbi:MAG: phosphatase PAP2 family protein [Bacteroidetes bacterium]|nr:phosphatase PAP2 family protein [Bacteroidota bacterium]
MLHKQLYEHRFAYFIWLCFFLTGIGLITFTKPEFAILGLNKFYSYTLTVFFEWATRFGEVLGFGIAFFWILLSGSYRQFFGFLMACLITLILVWILKHHVFPDAIRPIVYLEKLGLELPNRSSFSLNRQFSFPSGHTTSAFTYFFFVALCRKVKPEVFLAVMIAVLVATSRVYLAQHFVIDVTAGSATGVVVSSVSYYLWDYRWKTNSEFLNRKIINPGRAKN